MSGLTHLEQLPRVKVPESRTSDVFVIPGPVEGHEKREHREGGPGESWDE